MNRDLEMITEDVELPDGAKAKAVSRPDLQDWGWEQGITLRQAEILALEQEVWPKPYLRNHRRFSLQDQIRLLSSRVLIVGLGGLGGVLLEILARTGVGRIRCLDPEVFEESNLNRQILAASDNLDQTKAEAAVARATAINPAVEMDAADHALKSYNGKHAFEGVDAVADGLGDLDGRALLWGMARKAGLPVASAAVAGSSGFAATLQPDGVDPSEVLAAAGAGAEKSLGTQGPAVHAAAGIQCSEIFALLLGQPPALSGKLLLFDLAQGNFETLTL
ncbi:MAG: ThiF family adenylyltransferase [Desulfovibrionaceae bacterium]